MIKRLTEPEPMQPGAVPVVAPSSLPPVPPPARRSRLAGLGRGLLNMSVLILLGGLAYAGHRTGWTLPSFASLTGKSETRHDDWCAAHGVPESICIECNPKAFSENVCTAAERHGWCAEHGVAECPLCHPDVAELTSPPEVSTADRDRARRALALKERTENNRRCPLRLRRLQFISAEAVEKAGIEIAPVWTAPMTEAIAAHAQIMYDPTRVAHLSARVPGTVWHVEKQIGDRVKRGEVLALVDAAEVGRAKAEFLHGLVQVELQKTTLANLRSAADALAARSILEAEARLREAEIRLLNAGQALVNLGLPTRIEDYQGLRPQEAARRIQFLGLPGALVRAQNPTTTTTNLLPLSAPLDGIVVAREVVTGEVVDTAKVLFVVADNSGMWLTLDVALEDAPFLKLGQPVRFTGSGGKEEAHGILTWISTTTDEKTRTVKARADLLNPDGRLRNATFGTARIVLREEVGTIVVPSEAVHWEGDCHVVFVRDRHFLEPDAPKVFHVRQVRVGAHDTANTEIIAGLLPGELVATHGSGALRSELLKNNLGAG